MTPVSSSQRSDSHKTESIPELHITKDGQLAASNASARALIQNRTYSPSSVWKAQQHFSIKKIFEYSLLQ